MYLFFDTETTGLPRSWKAPLEDLANWPRLVQIAWLLFDTDGHEISREKAIIYGLPLVKILEAFQEQLQMASHAVAHNISFDEKIVGAEFMRKEINNPLPFRNRICTMKSTTNYCKIKNRRGNKWPKLGELHQKLFEENFEDAHDAMADIHATAKCFWELRRRAVL
ncbi:MAG: 3'-5' exonuclease [Bacteroidetes bacterium SW_10_40_5]|nr:MAG: 3'-5' exonuclease [Bacteroidetes bacterium SW_10_40_5]